MVAVAVRELAALAAMAAMAAAVPVVMAGLLALEALPEPQILVVVAVAAGVLWHQEMVALAVQAL